MIGARNPRQLHGSVVVPRLLSPPAVLPFDSRPSSPALPVPRVRPSAPAPAQPDPRASEVSTTLTVSAGAAYEIFADAIEIPRWLPIVQTARIIARHADGRPSRVAFTRALERGSLGYTLEYRYDPSALAVAWQTPDGSNVVLHGEARFTALSMRACLMRYRLVIDLPIIDDLILRELDHHPASQVASEFREHLRRLC